MAAVNISEMFRCIYREDVYAVIVAPTVSGQGMFRFSVFQENRNDNLKITLVNLDNEDTYTCFLTRRMFEDLRFTQDLVIRYEELVDQLQTLLDPRNPGCLKLRLGDRVKLIFYSTSELKVLTLLEIPLLRPNDAPMIFHYLREIGDLKRTVNSLKDAVTEAEAENQQLVVQVGERDRIHALAETHRINLDTMMPRMRNLERENMALRQLMNTKTNEERRARAQLAAYRTINGSQAEQVDVGRDDASAMRNGISLYARKLNQLKGMVADLQQQLKNSVTTEIFNDVYGRYTDSLTEVMTKSAVIEELNIQQQKQLDENTALQAQLQKCMDTIRDIQMGTIISDPNDKSIRYYFQVLSPPEGKTPKTAFKDTVAIESVAIESVAKETVAKETIAKQTVAKDIKPKVTVAQKIMPQKTVLRNIRKRMKPKRIVLQEIIEIIDSDSEEDKPQKIESQETVSVEMMSEQIDHQKSQQVAQEFTCQKMEPQVMDPRAIVSEEINFQDQQGMDPPVIDAQESDSQECNSQEGHSHEGDSQEGNTQEDDTQESDSQEGRSQEVSMECNSENCIMRLLHAHGTSSEESDCEEMDSQALGDQGMNPEGLYPQVMDPSGMYSQEIIPQVECPHGCPHVCPHVCQQLYQQLLYSQLAYPQIHYSPVFVARPVPIPRVAPFWHQSYDDNIVDDVDNNVADNVNDDIVADNVNDDIVADYVNDDIVDGAVDDDMPMVDLPADLPADPVDLPADPASLFDSMLRDLDEENSQNN